MEGSHVNGVVESESTKDQPSIAGGEVNGHDKGEKETTPEPSEEAVEDQKTSFKFVLKTKTSVSSIEDDAEDKEKEIEGEKTHSYVIRSQTSVESHEDTKDNPRTPPSDAQLKFTVRTQSTGEDATTEEHGSGTRMKNAGEENGPITTTDEVFNDIGKTQNEDEKEIAAKATEIVATILEKLEDEERSKHDQQNVVEEKSDVEIAQEGVIAADVPAGEDQQLSEDKECKAEVEVMKFETNDEEIEVEQRVDIEAAPTAVAAEQEDGQVKEKEEKAEVVVMKFESNEEEMEEQETVDVQTKPEETPAAVVAVRDQHGNQDHEDKAEVVAVKFERKEEHFDSEETVNVETQPEELPAAVVAATEEQQPSEDQEGKAEVVSIKFESREEQIEVEETAEVETAPEIPTAAQEEQAANEDQEDKAELVTMKFEKKEEKVDVEETAEVETAPEIPTAAQEEQAANEDQEDKAELVTMKFEKKEEKVDVEETAEVETAPEVPTAAQEEQAANEDQEDKAEVVAMKFEKKEEKVDVEEMADVETGQVDISAAETVAEPKDQQPLEDKEDNAEVMTMKFESNEEKVEVEETADIETAPVAVVAVQEGEQPSEDQEGKAEVVALKFESREEEIEVEEKVDVETAPEVLPVMVAAQEEQPKNEDQEGKAEVVTMKFESREEEIEVEEKVDVETAPEVLPVMVAAQEEPQPATEDQEGKAEVVIMKFESNEEKEEVEERADVQEAPKEVLQAVTAHEEEKASEDQEGKAEVLAMKFESGEEKVEVEERVNVEAAQTDISAAAEEVRTTGEEDNKAEIVTMKFESSEESITREETVFEEAKEAKVFVDAVKVGTEGSQQDEEPLSHKQEYVAERFLNKPQSQHEIQDDGGEDSEELEEKPIVKVRIPEEPFQTDLNEEEDDVVEVHGTEVGIEEIITSPEFESLPAEAIESLTKEDLNKVEEENDSDGEIEIKIRRFSQENQELIHEESEDDEDSPVDWMAKDDVDEVVFRGEAVSPTSLEAEEPETKKQFDQETGPTKKEDSHILVESGGKIFIDDVVVPDTREVEVCSGLENMFAPEELREPEKFEPDESVLDYDIDKDIKEEQERLASEKRVAASGGKNVEVHEEVLANELKRKVVSGLDIKLMDENPEDDKVSKPGVDDDEEKPPSPLEAKEVKEQGIKEIFETETFRASGEFLSPVQEGDEYNTSASQKNSTLSFERKTAVVDEEALQASEQEKRCSLEWSLLDKWKEMELKAKRESLELEESKGETKIQSETINETESEQHEAAVLAVSETRENDPNITEFEIRETDEPEVTVTETTETTPSTVSKVTATKTVTKTRIIKARTEVQPDSQDEEIQEAPQVVPEAPIQEQEPRAPSDEPSSQMSTILFRMDGTPIVIPPEPPQAKVEEKPVEEPLKEEPELEGEAGTQADAAPMSTILFRMDGTPVVIPAAPKSEEKELPSPKPKSVVFSGVRPQSLASVESVRGEHEGVPPLAGEEESDIDDSSLHLAKHATGASKAPTVSPVKEVASPEKGSQPDEENEAESPLLDNSATPGQKCCVIL